MKILNTQKGRGKKRKKHTFTARDTRFYSYPIKCRRVCKRRENNAKNYILFKKKKNRQTNEIAIEGKIMFVGRLLENPNKSIGQKRVSWGKNGVYVYIYI